MAAHGRRHSAGGAPNWGGAGHPKEKEGAAAPSTEVHRGPGGPLAEPKAAGKAPAAVCLRRRCRRRVEVGGEGGCRGRNQGEKKKGKERKGKKGREKEREGKEMAGLGVFSPASWWPETPAAVVAGGASASQGKKKKKKKREENGEKKGKRKEKEKERRESDGDGDVMGVGKGVVSPTWGEMAAGLMGEKERKERKKGKIGN